MIHQKRQIGEMLPSAVTRHVTIQGMPKAIDSHERACAQDRSYRWDVFVPGELEPTSRF